MAWGEKLLTLDARQRSYSYDEKAINNILFEAGEETLHRDSVKINEGLRNSYSITSSRQSLSDESVWNVHHHQGVTPFVTYQDGNSSQTVNDKSGNNPRTTLFTSFSGDE
jgi:hypothetical protein